MKKKEALLMAVMGIITAAVILAGFNHSRERQSEFSQGGFSANQSQSEAFEGRKLEEEERAKAKFLGSFEKNRKKATVADFLQYVNYHKEAINIVYYGAITENAPWADAGLSQVARDRELTKVSRHYISLAEDAGFTEEAEIDKVIAHKPDLVFLALPQMVEAADEAALNEAELELFQAYEAIKAEAPDALIVLLSPVPSATEGEAESALQTYVAHMKKASEEKGLGFYDLHTHVKESVKATGGEIKNLFDEQQALNPEGNQLLQDAFSRNLQETVVDTSNAFQDKGKKKPEESSSKESESAESSSVESDQAASEQASLEQAALEQASLEEAALEQASLEQAALEQASLEEAAIEQASLEEAAIEQASLEEATRSQATREQAAREQAAREQAAREQAAREQAAREQAAHEQAAREQAAREQAAREQAAEEAARKAAEEAAQQASEEADQQTSEESHTSEESSEEENIHLDKHR